MSTSSSDDQRPAQSVPNLPPETGNQIADIVNVLKSVDTTSSETAQNATSMNDGKGGRITYNEDAPKTDVHDH